MAHRSGLFPCLLAAALCVTGLAAAEVPAGLRLRVAVLSDIHVRGRDKFLVPFAKALKWYDAQRVDGLVIAGDMADFGLVEQLQVVGEAIDEVFPNGHSARDGRSVERVFVTGNHDFNHFNDKGAKALYPDDKERHDRSMNKDFGAAFRQCLHCDYRPFFIQKIKGYVFVGRQFRAKGVNAYLEKIRSEIDPRKPFFFVQHQHPKDTCYGPDAWGHDDGDSTKALKDFPNAIVLSGHSHTSLEYEDGFWQKEFTSVGLGSLQYVVFRKPDGSTWGSRRHHQGLLMDVYDDRVVFVRLSFDEDSDCPKQIKTPWLASVRGAIK